MENSEIFKKNYKAILLLRLFVPGENNQSKVSVRGTGFIVSEDGKFITNTHVYKEIPEGERQCLEAQIFAKEEKGIVYYRSLKIELLKMDEINDLVLMKLKDDTGAVFDTVAKIGDLEKVEEGNELLSLGYPLATEMLSMNFGVTLSLGHSIISSIKRRQDASLDFFMIDAHVNNGSSGSPIFLKSTGEVIGVVSGRISQKTILPDNKLVDIPANLGICRPINYIKKLL